MRGQYLQVIEVIQQRAHDEAERGPMHSGRRGEIEYLVELLTEALSAEALCEWESRRLAALAHAKKLEDIAESLDQHAEIERRVVERLARRIRELGGKPPMSAESNSPELVPNFDGDDLGELLKEEIEVEEVAIRTCSEIAERLGDADPETRALLEQPAPVLKTLSPSFLR
jgi:bacterioferritin